MPKIGLCMIVKNEAHTIETCLRSVQPLIDYVLIEDTGSTDDTQVIIRRFLARENIPGEVFDEPWQDFAVNRSIGLARLRQVTAIDYALVMDADDVLRFDPAFDLAAFKAGMDKDVYDLPIRLGDVYYRRPQILNNRRSFVYRGVLHEFVQFPPGKCSHEVAEGLLIDCGTHGARSRNPQKYQDDAAVLARALAAETDPLLQARYTYYLAQSYRDTGDLENALTYYLRRSTLGYWVEEIYVSLLSAARIMQRLDYPVDDVIAAFERTAAVNPARAEALHGAAKLCNQTGRSAQAYDFAKRGLGLAQPEDGLFVEAMVYAYGMPDEFSIAAYWCGNYAACLDTCLTLLGSGALPDSERKRVSANASFALGKLPKTKGMGRLGTEDFVAQYPLQPDRPLRPALTGIDRCSSRSWPNRRRPHSPSTSSASRLWIIQSRRSRCIFVPTTTPTRPRRSYAVGRRGSALTMPSSTSTARICRCRCSNTASMNGTPQRFAVMGQLRNELPAKNPGPPLRLHVRGRRR